MEGRLVLGSLQPPALSPAGTREQVRAWVCVDPPGKLGPSFHLLGRTPTIGLVIVTTGTSGGISGRY